MEDKTKQYVVDKGINMRNKLWQLVQAIEKILASTAPAGDIPFNNTSTTIWIPNPWPGASGHAGSLCIAFIKKLRDLHSDAVGTTVSLREAKCDIWNKGILPRKYAHPELLAFMREHKMIS
jgi:hypothetical protein